MVNINEKDFDLPELSFDDNFTFGDNDNDGFPSLLHQPNDTDTFSPLHDELELEGRSPPSEYSESSSYTSPSSSPEYSSPEYSAGASPSFGASPEPSYLKPPELAVGPTSTSITSMNVMGVLRTSMLAPPSSFEQLQQKIPLADLKDLTKKPVVKRERVKKETAKKETDKNLPPKPKRKRKTAAEMAAMTPEELKAERKKKNNQSATKYRKKRKMVMDTLQSQIDELVGTVTSQKSTISSLESENKVLREQLDNAMKLLFNRQSAGSSTEALLPTAATMPTLPVDAASNSPFSQTAGVFFALFAFVLFFPWSVAQPAVQTKSRVLLSAECPCWIQLSFASMLRVLVPLLVTILIMCLVSVGSRLSLSVVGSKLSQLSLALGGQTKSDKKGLKGSTLLSSCPAL